MLIELNEQGETLDGKYKLVPKELTPEMIVAMARVRCESDEYAAALAVGPLPHGDTMESHSDDEIMSRLEANSKILLNDVGCLTPYAAIDFLRFLSIEIERRAADLRDQIQRNDI